MKVIKLTESDIKRMVKRVLKETLNIPFHEKLTKKQLKYVVENLNYSIKKFK